MKHTKYEKARIIGARALQLSMGAPFMIKLSKKDLIRIKYNTIEIAKLEFEKGVIPISIKRPVRSIPNENRAGKIQNNTPFDINITDDNKMDEERGEYDE